MAKTYVVICTRNRPQQLSVLMQDLGKQSQRIDKMVIVDSSDAPLSAGDFQAFQQSSIREVAYLHTQAGLPYQRNVALNFLKGEWNHEDTVHFLDDDVRVEAGFIHSAKTLVENHPDASVVGAWDQNLVKVKDSLARRLTLLGGSRDQGKILRSGCAIPCSEPESLQFVDWCPGFSMNFSVTKLVDFLFDGRYRMYGEDIEACVRLKLRGPILVSPGLSLYHFQNAIERDQAIDSSYFSDVFRWRLSRVEGGFVRKWAVLWSTLALLFGELALAGKTGSKQGRQRALGHARFFVDLILGRIREQLVQHDHDNLESKFRFDVLLHT